MHLSNVTCFIYNSIEISGRESKGAVTQVLGFGTRAVHDRYTLRTPELV